MKHVKYLLLLPLLLGALTGCHPAKGHPAIKEKEMAVIIADYHQIQSTLSQFPVPETERRTYYYAQILEKYGYTEAEFDSSLAWYTRNMDVMEKVYDEAYMILQARKDSLTQLMNSFH